ncbi:hypothetical protein Tco_0563477 [Tanacetum coccineum]
MPLRNVDDGGNDVFLGLQVNQSPRGIFINQSNYVLEILKKYGMESCDPIGTPMEIKDKLDLNKNRTLVDATKYHSMISTLMYLTSSISDIVHATCLGAWYQSQPTEKHLKEDSGFDLTGFSDADYTGCRDSFKSTSGVTQFLEEVDIRVYGSFGSFFLDVIKSLRLEYEYVAMNLTLLERGRFIIRTSLTGFPAQSVRSSNADALDSLYLLVSLYRTPQSRLPH